MMKPAIDCGAPPNSKEGRQPVHLEELEKVRRGPTWTKGQSNLILLRDEYPICLQMGGKARLLEWRLRIELISHLKRVEYSVR